MDKYFSSEKRFKNQGKNDVEAEQSSGCGFPGIGSTHCQDGDHHQPHNTVQSLMLAWCDN